MSQDSTPKQRYRGGRPRVEKRYEVDADTGCWNWLMATRNGYGILRDCGENRTWYAHRYYYEKATGIELHRSMQIHHTCRNRMCVNPSHLQLCVDSRAHHEVHFQAVMTWSEWQDLIAI